MLVWQPRRNMCGIDGSINPVGSIGSLGWIWAEGGYRLLVLLDLVHILRGPTWAMLVPECCVGRRDRSTLCYTGARTGFHPLLLLTHQRLAAIVAIVVIVIWCLNSESRLHGFCIFHLKYLSLILVIIYYITLLRTYLQIGCSGNTLGVPNPRTHGRRI